MSNDMRLLVSILLLLSLYTATSQKATHQHIPNKKQHGLDREEDGSLKSKYRPVRTEDEHDAGFDHEAILGSRQEAKKFDDLPPEEAKRRLKVLLGKMDLNLNEHIDKDEMHAWIMKSLAYLDVEDNKERFEAADSDTSGFVTWEEFKKSEYGGDEEGHYQWMEQDHYLFNAADKDRDGSLTLKEFNSYVQPDGDMEIQQHVLYQTLDEKDSDKNDLLNFDEFIRNRNKSHDKKWMDSERERFDNKLDKDGDGSLDSEEILDWIIPGVEGIATDEANHLISEADEDKDGVLSFKEILDKVDLFAGSEATDYGNHLTNFHRFEEEL